MAAWFLLIALAVILAVLGFVTAAKWLFIIVVLLIVAAVITGRRV